VNVSCCCLLYLSVRNNVIYSPWSTGAGHSVALKQFSPSSCIEEFMRKETYLLTKTFVIQNILILCNYNVAYKYKKNKNSIFLHDMLVNWSAAVGVIVQWYLNTIVLVMDYYSGTCLEGNLYRNTTCL